MSEDIRTHRLFEDESNYLKNHDMSFSDYVHASFKHNIELTKNNKHVNKLQIYSSSMILLALGAMFLFLTVSIRGLFGQIMVLLLGVFMTSYGAFNFYTEWRKR